MKILKTIAVAAALTMGVAFAGSSCHTNWAGNYVCTFDSGYTTSTSTDWAGNDVTTDNRGGRTSCHTNWAGNYVCN